MLRFCPLSGGIEEAVISLPPIVLPPLLLSSLSAKAARTIPSSCDDFE